MGENSFVTIAFDGNAQKAFGGILTIENDVFVVFHTLDEVINVIV